MNDLSDRERLRFIVKALADCKERVDTLALVRQFRHETARAPDIEDIQWVLDRFSKLGERL